MGKHSSCSSLLPDNSWASGGPATIAGGLLNLAPGVGLQWYLVAQAFPAFLPFFVYALRSLRPAVLPVALAGHAGLEQVLTVQALVCCLLAPAASAVTVSLWLVSTACTA